MARPWQLRVAWYHGNGRTHGKRRARRETVGLYILSLLGAGFSGSVGEPALAKPPRYPKFDRPQRVDYSPEEGSLLRIWAIYVGQGDALLVQFPTGPPATASDASEPVELLVDAGPTGQHLPVFLKSLYPNPTTLEHVVVTHHDGDHIKGLITLLDDDDFAVDNIYHNGLASWRLGSRGFPFTDWPSTSEAVFKKDSNKGMAVLEPDGRKLQNISLISTLAALRTAVSDDALVGDYKELGRAIVDDTIPSQVARFRRTYLDDPVLASSHPQGMSVGEVRVEPLWPLNPPRRYGGWAYTINGNSVTFKLVYGDFSMLFPGDHNEDSQRELLRTFEDADRVEILRSDVLKVSHHGSKHGIEAFFDAVDPVLSVASMGSRGFGRSWKHPSTDVICWLGGTDRVYHTYIHERPFVYSQLKDEQVRSSLIETKHVLCETDGHWFRIVEVEDPTNIPTVSLTQPGDGTRWVRAAE
ncbi:MAG: ComEC/Rec2 family competence protein [Planctomycetota bacterium]